ncbi:MAG: hypothetical protein U9N51_07225 [Bacteroidota bacterium]|nr:hypothetical protein [Bacteroidota bacterium]
MKTIINISISLIIIAVMASCGNQKGESDQKTDKQENLTKSDEVKLSDKTDESKDMEKYAVSVLSQMTVFGTEPFWAIELNVNDASYSTPSIQLLKLNYLYPNEEATCDLKQATKKLDDNAVRIRLQDVETGHISVLTIHEKVCNDGMSENEYPFTVSYKANSKETLPGCGRIREK